MNITDTANIDVATDVGQQFFLKPGILYFFREDQVCEPMPPEPIGNICNAAALVYIFIVDQAYGTVVDIYPHFFFLLSCTIKHLGLLCTFSFMFLFILFNLVTGLVTRTLPVLALAFTRTGFTPGYLGYFCH
jgi:hypothetical protein